MRAAQKLSSSLKLHRQLNILPVHPAQASQKAESQRCKRSVCRLSTSGFQTASSAMAQRLSTTPSISAFQQFAQCPASQRLSSSLSIRHLSSRQSAEPDGRMTVIRSVTVHRPETSRREHGASPAGCRHPGDEAGRVASCLLRGAPSSVSVSRLLWSLSCGEIVDGLWVTV